MPGIEIDGLIRRFDDTVRYRQQLFNFNLAEEVNSVLQICVKNQATVKAQLDEKTEECEYFRECLKIAHDKVTKLYAQFENRINYYQGFFENNLAKEFLDFTIFLKNRNETDEKSKVTLNTDGDESFRRYEELIQKHFAKELFDDNIKHELEVLKLQLAHQTEECDQLKIRLNEANGNISTLNSELAAARESLNIEKLQRDRVENERSNLENEVLKYQQSVCPLHEARETFDQTSPDHSATAEENLIGINSGIDFDHGFPISPPFDFRDDIVSVKNNDLQKSFFGEHERDADTSALEETSNLSVWRKLREHVPSQCTNHFANKSISSLTAAENETPIQSDVSDVEIDHHFHSVQESYGANSPIDNSKSIAVKNGGEVEKSFTDPFMHSPDSLETNGNLISSKILNERKSISKTDVMPNSVTPVQPHFSCDICRKSFLKKAGLACHMRIHTISNRSFHCEKCGKSFMAKRREQKRAKCPNCDVRYNTRSRKNNTELIGSPLETMKNSEIEDVDYVHKECNNGNSNAYCDICGKSYSRKSTLKKHIREVHEGKKPFECDTCGKRFAQKVHLKSHTATHESDKPFKCSVCNECFKYSNSKRYHEHMVHEGYAPFQCAHCDKRCTQKPDLISHIFSQHFPGTRKQFKCDICDKSFAIRPQLNKHKLVHMSQRPFKCSICDQRFKRHDSKLQHERIIHEKSGRFYCAHCEKSYTDKRNLSKHLQKVHI